MKKTVIAYVFTFIILSAELIYSHGFGTHAAHLQKIVQLNLPGSYLDIINDDRWRPYFIYGSIFPDIQYTSNYKASLSDLYQRIADIDGVEKCSYIISLDHIPDVNTTPYPFGIDTHDDKYGMAFAEYLFVQSGLEDPPGPDPGFPSKTDSKNRKIAFALGYYAHLAEDVAAHDFLIPKLTAALNLGDIELIKNSQSFIQDPNAQTEGIIETLIDHYHGDNTLVYETVFWDIWVLFDQKEPTLAQMNPYNWTYDEEIYDPLVYGNTLNPVLVFFNEVLNDWYNNNPFGLPTGDGGYRKNNSPVSIGGLSQLATVFRFVNRFYPAIAGEPFNGYDRLDQVLADWIGNHLDLEDGFELLEVLTEFLFNLVGNSFRQAFFEGYVYPHALATTNEDLAKDARSLISIMLADINEADLLVSSKPDLININEYNRLKNSILFTNPQSILDSYWEEYISLGSRIYAEIGPPNKWYSDWSPWHSYSMAWGALSSLNNLIPEIYATNPNVAVYDAYFEVNGSRITGPQQAQVFDNNPNVKVVVELYNTSNVSSESITLRVKKDHSSSNYSSDILKQSTTFTIDHDPLTYNSTARKRVELAFPVTLSDLSGYKGYYFELVNNSNNKVIFSSSFEQYQERLDLTPNYTRLYGTYDEGKWPVSLGLVQNVATVNLTTAQFPEGGSGGSYKINGISQSSIIGYVYDYINLEAISPTGYVFYQWSDGNTENPRTYRIPSTTVNLNAIYKGISISNNQNAYLNNSQRKFLRTCHTNNGPPVLTTLHSIYESLNKIWYETSTDNGITWRIVNNGKPLGDPYAISSEKPSITELWPENGYGSNNHVLIAYADYYLNDPKISSIKVAGYYLPYDNKFLDLTIYDGRWDNDHLTNPVIAHSGGGQGPVSNFISVFEVKSSNWFEPGLYYCLARKPYNGNYELVAGPVKIQDTDGNSFNPAISTYHNHYAQFSKYHIAWEQRITTNNSQIRYLELDVTGTVDLTVTPSNYVENLAYESGFPKNFNPSIIALPDGNTRVVWIGGRNSYADGPEGEGDGSGDPVALSETRVFYKSKNNNAWSAFHSYGNNINSVSLNRNDNFSYAFAWSEGISNINKFVRSDNLTGVYTTNTTGKYLQVGNYPNLGTMRLNSFTTSTTPYSFSLSNPFTVIPQEEDSQREGIIVQDTTAFYFSFGDIKVDNESVDFIEVPDTFTINNQNDLNSYLVSKPFDLTDNSVFTYGIRYGITDSLSAALSLNNGRNINFKVQLVDNQTGEVLGTLNDVTYSEGNIIPYENIAYQVNNQGIGSRTCKLKVKAVDNLAFNYSLVNSFNNGSSLYKKGFVEILFKGDEVITTYDLFQNYPNPFNPITTIKYQIPEDGIVSLKIYDILGKEIKTLVNEHKPTGRYEINFDASNLASGVYIYRIQVNDFISSKKMLLLK